MGSTLWYDKWLCHEFILILRQQTTAHTHGQGIYFKELDEDDEDEVTVLKAIKLYGPKTDGAKMDFSKLEKVG